MMKKSFSIVEYMRSNGIRENRWSGYNAIEDTELEGVPEGEEEFAFANGGSDKTPKPYVVQVANSTASNLTATLFGLNRWLLTSNFGSDSGVTVTPLNTSISYLELLQQSGQQPFETSLIRVSSANTTQISQTLNVTKKDASGQVFSDSIYADPYISAYQYQNGRVDIPYGMTIDANTYIQFTILASTTCIVTFFPGEKVNIAKGLAGSNPRTLYGAPPVNLGGVSLPSRPGLMRSRRS